MPKLFVKGVTSVIIATTTSLSAAHAEGTLNLLTWEGYADPSFVTPFEEATGCKVTATLVGSNDDYIPKLMAGGGAYDLVTPTIDTTMPLILNDLVEPLDLSQLPSFEQLFDQFKALEGINHEGQVYGVPWVWGSNPLMYRVDMFPTPPDSVAVLSDPALAGRISIWDDKSSLYIGARMLGITGADVFTMTDAQLEQVRDALVAQKPLVKKYWASAGELIGLYASGDVWISNTWGGYQSGELLKQGIEVKEFIPKEGVDGWVDAWQVVKGTPNRDCAYKFLEMTLSPLGQCGQVGVTGYSPTNPVAVKDCLTAERLDELHMSDEDYRKSIVYQRNLG
ncbi:MAG TPA: ABC transporter substrate-binding protein, partial [Azonexus sp.]|nr:ABC transporter substrate-binding protein [Azonexus sp.]